MDPSTQLFAKQLNDMSRVPSNVVIKQLTRFVYDHKSNGFNLLHALLVYLYRKSPEQRLAGLYVFDSIARNIAFQKDLRDNMLDPVQDKMLLLLRETCGHYALNEETHVSLRKLIDVWEHVGVFPAIELAKLKTALSTTTASSGSNKRSSCSDSPPEHWDDMIAELKEQVSDKEDLRALFARLEPALTKGDEEARNNALAVLHQTIEHAPKRTKRQVADWSCVHVKRMLAIEALYRDLPLTCVACGMRLSTSESMSAHQTLHYHQNQRLERAKQTAPSTQWYLDAAEWSLTTSLFLPSTLLFGKGGGLMRKEEDTSSAAHDTKDAFVLPIELDEEKQKACCLCSSAFEVKWNDDLDSWTYPNSVRIRIADLQQRSEHSYTFPLPFYLHEGRIAHPVCIEQTIKSFRMT